MDLREEFKKEKGYGVMAVRQDYAGQRPYEDGFCDEYVEWLEAKVKKLSLHNVSQQRELLLAYTTALRENFIGCDVSQINHRDVDWFLKANNCG